jgi:rod shape-determining protein MreD
VKRIAVISLLCFCAIVVEQSVLPFLVPGQIPIRLMTVIVACLAIGRPPAVAALGGFVIGVALSLASGEPLGIASLALSLIGWSAAVCAMRFHLDNVLAQIGLVFALLTLEMAVTFLAAWAVFDIPYRFSVGGMALTAFVSPAVLWAVSPALARQEAVEQNTI